MRYLIAESSWESVALARALQDRGVLLTRTDRPEDIPHLMDTTEADIVVIEATQLGRGGLSLPALRRRRSDRPLAVLARRPDRAQVVAWLEAGADTVIDSAAPTDEMVARLQAVARRVHGLASPVMRLGGVSIDTEARRVACNGALLQLSPKVYEILEYIALRPGRLVTRDALLTHVYGYENEPDARVFDVYMCTLRSQLATVGAAIAIETARGAGFRLTVPEPERVAA